MSEGDVPPPPAYGCLTLTTDYGYAGGFVGALHAVAFSIAPSVTVIDLDHLVPPQDVRLGALRLERFARFAPAGVHVGVVDPGVGSSRRAVAISAGHHVFVGPDNGLLVWAAEASAAELRAVELDRPEIFLEPRSRTFDGRDVFVPVAARIASGLDLFEAGSEIEPASLVRLERPSTTDLGDGSYELDVLQVDHFGNLQLSGDESTARALGLAAGDGVTVFAGRAVVEARYGRTFDEVPKGGAVVLVDSDGCLALSVNCGRADALVGTPPPPSVTLRAS